MTDIILKGRGHKSKSSSSFDSREKGRGETFESIQSHSEKSGTPAISVEGWIIIVTNVHPEAQEDDIMDKFAEYGEVKNIHVNLDRQTGFVKGYALIEYKEYEEALEAIKNMNNKNLLGQTISVDWTFVNK